MRCVSLIVVSLLGIVAYGGCASEEGGAVFDMDAGGTCNVMMCPAIGMGVPCCVDVAGSMVCGNNFNQTGCVANAPDAG